VALGQPLRRLTGALARGWLYLFADVRKELATMVAAMDIPVPGSNPVPGFIDPPRSGRIPVDEITARAREAHAGHALLTAAGAVLFGTGWLLAKIFGGGWLCVSWCWTACQMGWAEARGKGPSKSRLMEENEALRMAVRRLGGEA
jgi:hypothetical protein